MKTTIACSNTLICILSIVVGELVAVLPALGQLQACNGLFANANSYASVRAFSDVTNIQVYCVFGGTNSDYSASADASWNDTNFTARASANTTFSFPSPAEFEVNGSFSQEGDHTPQSSPYYTPCPNSAVSSAGFGIYAKCNVLVSFEGEFTLSVTTSGFHTSLFSPRFDIRHVFETSIIDDYSLGYESIGMGAHKISTNFTIPFSGSLILGPSQNPYGVGMSWWGNISGLEGTNRPAGYQAHGTYRVRVTVVSAPCCFSLSSSEAGFCPDGGTGEVDVYTNPDCPWTATSQNPGWLTITSSGGGMRPNTVTYAVAANNTSSSRTGTLTIAGQTFTVIQKGPIIGVLLLKQYDTNWGTNVYGQYAGPPNTIAKWGCQLTSYAMLFNYYAHLQGINFTTTPDVLNNWLKSNDGYDLGDDGIKSRPNPHAVVRYARANGVTNFYYSGPKPGRNSSNDGILNSFLCNEDPVLLRVHNGGHAVVATGKVVANGDNTYAINDPGVNVNNAPPGCTVLKCDRYGNTYQGLRCFSWSETLGRRFLNIARHCPVEILVTDPQGRQTGFDPRVGTAFNEIPEASYDADSIEAADGSGDTIGGEPEFECPDPIDGIYLLEVFGTNSGPFTIDIIGYDLDGNPSMVNVSGNASPGSYARYAVSYSSVAGSTITVFVPPMITGQPQSLTVASGNPANFSVTATGTVPFAYHWQKDGTNLVNGGNVSGATTNTLALNPTTAGDAGDYRVIITNAYGSVTSSVATLTVASPLLITAPTWLGNGQFQFVFACAPGMNYTIQYSTTLTSWIPVLTLNGPGGPITIVDPNATDPVRFYRVVAGP